MCKRMAKYFSFDLHNRTFLPSSPSSSSASIDHCTSERWNSPITRLNPTDQITRSIVEELYQKSRSAERHVRFTLAHGAAPVESSVFHESSVRKGHSVLSESATVVCCCVAGRPHVDVQVSTDAGHARVSSISDRSSAAHSDKNRDEVGPSK